VETVASTSSSFKSEGFDLVNRNVKMSGRNSRSERAVTSK
jgi:hypothetical protein